MAFEPQIRWFGQAYYRFKIIKNLKRISPKTKTWKKDNIDLKKNQV